MHNRVRCGEVAEPGLRRTPGTRVDSKGSRGFESPPLRHPVRYFGVLQGKLGNSAHARAFPSTSGHRRNLDSAVSNSSMLESLYRESSRCPSTKSPLLSRPSGGHPAAVSSSSSNSLLRLFVLLEE